MKKISLTITVFLFFSLWINLLAQNEVAEKYKEAKAYFDEGRYNWAQQSFKPLTSEYSESAYTPYALFYYAISAYKNGEKNLAENSFRELKQRYPNWKQVNEADIWLARLQFEKKEYLSGLELLEKVPSYYKVYVSDLKTSYLSKITGQDTIQALFTEYPNDKEVATAMAQSIIQQPVFDQDRELLNKIVQDFQLDEKRFQLLEENSSEFKPRYQVAIMLPLFLDRIEKDPFKVSNQWVINLYQGIITAIDELSRMGVNIEYYVYDTRRDEAHTRMILEKPEMRHMDLVIGPLYPGPVRAATQFCFDTKINIVNPLSSNITVTENNPYSFLYLPGDETKARLAADYVASNTANKNAMIFYGSSSTDSLMAYSYKDQIEQYGFKIAFMEKILSGNPKRVLDILANSRAIELDASEFDSTNTVIKRNQRDDDVVANLRITEKEIWTIKPDSIGHIFIATEDESIAANAITSVETRGDTITIVGLEEWLDKKLINYDAIERLGMVLISPTLCNYHGDAYKYFEQSYKEKYYCLPDKYAVLGHETMVVFGKLLKEKGNLFQFTPSNNGVKVNGDVLPGYYFKPGQQDNQLLQITTIKKGITKHYVTQNEKDDKQKQ